MQLAICRLRHSRYRHIAPADSLQPALCPASPTAVTDGHMVIKTYWMSMSAYLVTVADVRRRGRGVAQCGQKQTRGSIAAVFLQTSFIDDPFTESCRILNLLLPLVGLHLIFPSVISWKCLSKHGQYIDILLFSLLFRLPNRIQ